MDKDVNKIMEDAKKLEDRLEIIVSETAIYKATREELGEINSEIREVLLDIEKSIESYKQFEDTKNSLVDNYNKNTKKILEELNSQKNEINKLVKNNELLFDQQKAEYNNIIENLEKQSKSRRRFYMIITLVILLNSTLIIVSLLR